MFVYMFILDVWLYILDLTFVLKACMESLLPVAVWSIQVTSEHTSDKWAHKRQVKKKMKLGVGEKISGILPLPGFVEGGQGIVLYLEYSDDADHEYDILFI